MDITNIQADKELVIVKNIYDEIGLKVNEYLKKHKNIYLEANPGYGKTFHIAQIGNDIIKGNSIYQKIIFCTPRLIIQEQIEKDFTQGVHFKLNGDAKIEDFIDSHKIITSTFDSLYLIADKLNEKDLIVIDEAHELLRNYHSAYKLNNNPYYEKTLQTLFHSGSSKILMSGTPTNNFHELLKLKHLKIIKKNESQVLINVDFTKLNPKELAYRYCEKYSEDYSSDKLNIIYIKNKSDCSEIAYYLNSKGYRTKVLTSKTKTEDVYLNIAEYSKVPDDIQFIITTNVISVGTNINNENIGGIAMINEYDPIEIKQFAKRFRNATNLKIDIINKIVKRKPKSKSKLTYTHNLNKKITFKQIEVQLELLKSFTEAELLFFKNMSYEKNDLSSPRYVINQAIEKYIANESFLYRLYMNSFSTPSKLVQALNGYNDIKASITDINQTLFDDLEREISKEARAFFKSRITSIIEQFIENKTSFIYYSLLILEHNDFEKRERFKAYINKHINLLELKLNDNLHKIINSRLFLDYILNPLIEFIPYFNSLDLCLKFLKAYRPEARRKHILSLYVNRLIYEHCELKKINKSNLIHYKNGGVILQDVELRDKLILDLVKVVFEHLFNIRVLHVHDFREFISNDKRIQGIIKKADKSEFPFNMLSDNKFNTNFLLGLINGIFLLSNKKRVHRDTSGKLRKAFIFENDFKKYKNNIRFYNTIHVKKTERSKKYSKVKLIRILNTSTDINKVIEI